VPFHHVAQTPPEIFDALASAYRTAVPDSPLNLSSLRQALNAYQAQGHLNRLPPGKLARLLDSVGTAIDAMGGSFTMPYATVAVTAKRTGARAQATPSRT
jgi:hypothetical protein